MINPSFEDGWLDKPAGNTINQQPDSWILGWLNPGDRLWDGGESDIVTGVPECVHKHDWQLPPEEQVDGPPDKRLILDGTTTYKMFNSGAVFGVYLEQTVSGLKPGTVAVITTNVWCQVPNSTDPYAAEYRMQTNGQGNWWQYVTKMPSRTWVERKQTRLVPASGEIRIRLEFKCKYQTQCDFFVDDFSFKGEFVDDPEPPPPQPAGLPGGARIDYKRKYVLFHADTPVEWLLETRRVTYAAGFRVTIGGGVDDAGIGNILDDNDRAIPLTNRMVIAVNPDMWGDEQHGDGTGLKAFLDFYYPGTDYTAVNSSSAADCAQRVLAALRGIDPGIPPVEIDVPIFWQCDPDWAAYPCGYGPKTLCQYGCLITVYTMWLRYFGLNQERNVLEENNYFRDSGGFSGYYLNSMAMSKVYAAVADDGWLTFAGSGHVMHDNIKDYLMRGIPVPARVDLHPETPDVWEQHWVLVVGWDQDRGDYLVNDPWLDKKSAYLKDLYDTGGTSDIHTALFYYPLENPPPAASPLIGIHAPADGGNFHAGVIDEMVAASPDTVKVLSSHSESSLVELKRRVPNAKYIIRAFLDFGGRNVTSQQFVDWTLPDVERSINALGGDVAGIELHNEPNLYAEGLGSSWSNGLTFSWWYLDVIRLYRAALPGFRYIFPGLSPGGSVAGVRLDSVSFMAGAADSIMISDDLGIHVYWATQNGWPMSKALDEIRAAHLTFPSKKLWITEFSNNRPGVTPEQKASEYADFGRACADLGYVDGVASYVISATDPIWGWESGSCETWTPVGIGKLIGELTK